MEVALQGDTAVVGDPSHSLMVGPRPKVLAGQVLVFTRDGCGVWSETAILTAPDIVGDDRFGSAIDGERWAATI